MTERDQHGSRPLLRRRPSIARRATILVVGLALLAGCGGGGHPSTSPASSTAPTTAQTKHELTGSVVEGLCGFSTVNVHQGDQVTLTDGKGNTIGVGTFGAETAAPSPLPNGTCVLPFTIPDVPETPFYSLAAGQYPPLTYSLSTLQTKDWNLGVLALGQ